MKLPVPAPQLPDLLKKIPTSQWERVLAVTDPEVNGVYEHWDHLRHRSPPAGLTHEQWWAGLKIARNAVLRPLPLTDKSGNPITVAMTHTMQRKLHFLDREAAGVILGANQDDDQSMRRSHLMRSLIEEAMTSSQLEGASTTRQVAKEILSTGRAPKDRSEQMIFNNYRAMKSLGELRDQPLSVAGILELHRQLMQDAIDDPADSGRLRTVQDDVVVQDRGDPTVTLHVPPKASELRERLEALCKFANDRSDGGEFLHPIIRAIAIHFQIGYDHPFVDGNGRTARALFYWSMLRSGYWLTEYISISSVLRKAPGKYGEAYLHSESDAADMSYFAAHQLDVIIKAVNGVRDYIARKATERRQAETLLRPGSRLGQRLNHRQRSLLMDAIRRPEREYTIAHHQALHRVTYATARSDLLGLLRLKLMTKRQVGKAFVFRPVAALAQKLEN